MEDFRIVLLQAARASAPYGLSVATYLRAAKLAGFREADDRLVVAELAYLRDKALLATEDKTISPENIEHRITAAGRDYLATRGL